VEKFLPAIEDHHPIKAPVRPIGILYSDVLWYVGPCYHLKILFECDKNSIQRENI
jgi:hypothetical protein